MSRRVLASAAVIAALVFAAALPCAGAGTGEVALSVPAPTREILPNGLRVLVMESHGAPIVSVQVWYHVGSKNEGAGQRGLAHLFEHLMFLGTDRFPGNSFDTRLNSVGGTDNAFTTEDVTAYHEVLPAEYLDVALELEADRMRHLKLTAEMMRSEREVVKEEKRLRMDNDPSGKAVEAFRPLAFTTHPYSWTPAGTLQELDGVSVPDAQAFYDRWYQPNDAVLVIVGDVSAREAVARAKAWFGKIPRGPEPSRVLPQEPPQTEMRERTLTLDTQLPQLIGGYHIPGASSPDLVTLQVLGVVLSHGESSRLHRELVEEKEVAVAASAWVEELEDPGLFIIAASFLPDVKPREVRSALLAEVERVANAGITDHELTKAKNQLIASHVFSLERAEGLGMSLASAEVMEGDYRRFLDETARFERVNAADVQAAAKKYLVRSNLTLVTVVPKEAP